MRLISIFILIIVYCSPLFAIEPGTKAPDFSLIGNDGKSHSISELNGKVILLDFWASWCGPCKKSLPWLSELRKETSTNDLEIVAVNLDTEQADAIEFIKRYKIDLKVLFDAEGKTPQQYKLTTMPSSYLIGRDGNIHYVFEGFHEDDKEKIKSAITELISKGER